MSTTGQGMSFADIEQIVAQRVTNAIEAITIYETKTRVARDSIDQVARQGAKIVKNVNNKRKWESGYGENSSQQQNKQQKVVKAYNAGPNSKKGRCQKIGHQSKDYKSKTPATASNSKRVVTCFGCDEQGHYKNRMPKVIKGEFEKIKDVKVEDVPLTCDTPLEVFNNEVSRLSGMDDDLFTYEVEVANIPCDSKMDDDSEQEADDDTGYDPSDVAFIEWLGQKNFNYKIMDHCAMKALWIYWNRGDDEV
ncbi:hypothetical protein Tco_1202215 [Tanacetum coccineum]